MPRDERDDGGSVGAHCCGETRGVWAREGWESVPCSRQAQLGTTHAVSTDRGGGGPRGDINPPR